MDNNDETNLISLSNHLRPVISLSSRRDAEPIGEALADFAVNRHRVGPALHLARQLPSNVTTDKDAVSILKSSYQKNVYESLRQQAAEKKISDLLIANSVPYTFLKGRSLARQLFDDPTARQSKDVDILIPPDFSSHAIDIFNNAGYIYKPYTLRQKKMFQRARQDQDIGIFKDLTFIDPDFSVPVELHKRLFKSEPKALTTDFNRSIDFAARPSLSSSYYCLYLILHGALAFWPRLKWVMDLSIIARRMPVQNRLKMLGIAKLYGCDAAVAASLFMTEDVFSDSLDDDWHIVLEKYKKDKDVHEMKSLFYESLASSSIDSPSRPLNYKLLGSAHFIFAGKVGLFDSLYSRFLNSLAIRI